MAADQHGISQRSGVLGPERVYVHGGRVGVGGGRLRRADYELAGAFLAAILAGAAPMVNLPHRSGRTKF